MTQQLGVQRMMKALRGDKPDRTPVMPKIWVDFSAEYTGTDMGQVIGDPFTAMDVIRRAARGLSLDGMRTFFFPARQVEQRDGELWELDGRGRRRGVIDTRGGLATLLRDEGFVDIADPYFVAFCQFYKQKTPFVGTMDDVRRMAVPTREYYRSLGFDKMLERIMKDSQGMAVVGNCGTGSLSHMVYMMGMERALYTLADDPALAHALLEKGAEIAIQKGMTCIDSGIRILRLNDSVGNMSVVSPSMWREYVLPVFREVCRALKQYCPDALLYCHICGNVYPVVRDLAGSGLDCIGPMDPLGGHGPGDYRRELGDGFCLMGGVNTLTLLGGSPEDVGEECARCIAQAGSRGAYVLGSGCAVPRDTPPENIAAMVGAAEKVPL